MNKKFWSCNCIEHEVVLDYMNVVRHCSNHNFSFGGRPAFYENFDGVNFTKEEFFKRKWELRKMFRDGNCPSTCQKCIHLAEKEWSDENYITFILLTPWVECNSQCVYCPMSTDDYVKNNTKKYDVYSVIKYMMDNDFFIPETIFDFAGGEPTLYERFDDILALILERGYKNVVIHTNGIIYSENIAKLINQGKCKVLISVDSANRELYKKIKRVDKFDSVKETMRKYAAAQSEIRPNAMKSKYIIVPGINDSEECITEWLDMCQSLGIISVILNLDFNWIEQNSEKAHQEALMPRSPENITLKLYDLIDFTKKEAQKRGIVTSLYGEIFTVKTIVEGDVSLNIVED